MGKRCVGKGGGGGNVADLELHILFGNIVSLGIRVGFSFQSYGGAHSSKHCSIEHQMSIVNVGRCMGFGSLMASDY